MKEVEGRNRRLRKIKRYIKSPLNYTGNKFKLLPQIEPMFPKKINTFVDVFGGAFNVGMNVEANKIVYNELNKKVFDLVKFLSSCDFEKTNDKIEEIIRTVKIKKGDKLKYFKLREHYNEKNNHSIFLFILQCFSFCYQIRFNKKGKFNMPCGNRDYSENMKNYFKESNKLCKSKNIEFSNKSFIDLDIDSFAKDDFFYFDPPYLQTIATYTENDEWNLEKELSLYSFIDNLNSKGIKFALSNTMYYHNLENLTLKNWSKKYNIKELDFNYTNNNRFNKDNSEKTVEVLITNYEE